MEQQNSEIPTTRAAGIRYGLILGVISITYFLILTLSGVGMQGPAGYVSYLFVAGAIFLGHKYFKDNGNGYMSIGQGVGIAFWTGLISSVISSIFTFVYAKFIDSGFIDAIKDKQLEEMENKNMSPEQIEQAMKITSSFMTPEVFLIMGIVMGIIGSVIVGLIVSIFTKNANPEAEI
ncbi:MAG: DUF4199 domain-containing protein [Azospira oryzae]|jgi:hypothetical protein|nr:DUF4199 domain-containing protein [Cytophaga sp.]PZR41339.1 MAG: DUF4199 domain-containing protein [Azospira oryzae]